LRRFSVPHTPLGTLRPQKLREARNRIPPHTNLQIAKMGRVIRVLTVSGET